MPAKQNQPVESSSDREIVISRVFGAPRELVWEAWTNPEHVAKWWGPRGFSTTIEVMDVRPGGVWKQVMHGPDKSNYPNASVFKEVVKHERIVYSHGGGKEGGPGVHFTSTWTFDAVETGKTKLTIHMVFATAADRDIVVKEYGAIEGGQQTLARLAEHLPVMEAGQLFVISRVFDAPRELVFKAWTDAQHVMRWWGPKGFTSPFCNIDLRLGGAFLFCMRSPDGKDYWSKGFYHEIISPKKIVSTMFFSDKDGDFVEPAHYGLPAEIPSEMLDTVTFEIVDGGKTKLTLHRNTPIAIAKRIMMDQGWNQSLDRFAAALEIT